MFVLTGPYDDGGRLVVDAHGPVVGGDWEPAGHLVEAPLHVGAVGAGVVGGVGGQGGVGGVALVGGVVGGGVGGVAPGPGVRVHGPVTGH